MLTIVIPALNEEASIGAVCKSCMDCREMFENACGEEIEVIVIDDGSTDQTAEIAKSIPGVQVFSFEKNRGYGAALKKGFQLGRGDLVSFLDADGTCDPKAFIPMVKAVKAGSSVAIGNRLGEESKMPRIRRLGNRFFAWLIRALSSAPVGDSASGMRVIRREALPLLYPLPDGLHFTPAMSCRAALDPRLKLTEIPMGYEEREGRSKLGVFRDGIRFLQVILEIAIIYRPLLLFGFAGCILLFLGLGYSISPAFEFFQTGGLQGDRVYRVLSILVFITGGFGFIYAGALADRAQTLVNPPRNQSKFGRILRKLFFAHPFLLAGVCFLLAILINAKPILEYLSEGRIYAHWARVAFGGLIGLIGLQLLAFGLLQHVLDLLMNKLEAERFHEP
jgi:hypothetical protein